MEAVVLSHPGGGVGANRGADGPQVALGVDVTAAEGEVVALDGLDREYVEYLDRLFTRIEDACGPRIWWTTLADVAARVRVGTRESGVVS